MQLVEAVLHVYKDRLANRDIAHFFLLEVGNSMEVSLEAQPFTDDVLKCLTLEKRHARVGRAVRKALGELPMSISRTAFRASKILRRIGMVGGAHQTWVDAAYMRRYLVAMRYWFEKALSVSITTDKSRNSGKDWLGGCVYFYDFKKAGWLQPVAAFVISRPSTPNRK